MFVDPGLVAKSEDGGALQGRQRVGRWLSDMEGPALRWLSSGGGIWDSSICRVYSGQYPMLNKASGLSEEGPLPERELVVYLAFNQRPLGLLSETFDQGPIIVAYSVEKGGQFKESLDKTTATTTKQPL